LWSRDVLLLTASTPSLEPLSVLSISYPQTLPRRKISRGVQLNGRFSRSAARLNLHFAIASVTSLWDGCQLCTATNLHLLRLSFHLRRLLPLCVIVFRFFFYF
jgi:hypothetical protein